jgi:hypothetical protein
MASVPDLKAEWAELLRSVLLPLVKEAGVLRRVLEKASAGLSLSAFCLKLYAEDPERIPDRTRSWLAMKECPRVRMVRKELQARVDKEQAEASARGEGGATFGHTCDLLTFDRLVIHFDILAWSSDKRYEQREHFEDFENAAKTLGEYIGMDEKSLGLTSAAQPPAAGETQEAKRARLVKNPIPEAILIAMKSFKGTWVSAKTLAVQMVSMEKIPAIETPLPLEVRIKDRIISNRQYLSPRGPQSLVAAGLVEHQKGGSGYRLTNSGKQAATALRAARERRG